MTALPTQRNSCRGAPCRRPRLLRRAAAAALLLALVCLGGCSTLKPEEFFELSPESPAIKAMQTRSFETGNEKELLSASAAVLQDLGFQVEDVVREVGVLRAAKERSAREYGQDIGRFIISTITIGYVRTTTDLHQRISAVLVIRPVNAAGTWSEVRVNFYRVVWKSEGYIERHPLPPGEQRMEMINDPEIYRQFFAKLSKAVFLEAFTL